MGELRAAIKFLLNELGIPAGRTESKIDLNVAGWQELSVLLEGDEETAKEIISYRESHGQFRSWNEVRQLPGITARMESVLREKAILEQGDCFP